MKLNLKNSGVQIKMHRLNIYQRKVIYLFVCLSIFSIQCTALIFTLPHFVMLRPGTRNGLEITHQMFPKNITKTKQEAHVCFLKGS